MKWFYKLNNTIRVLIAIVAWVPFLILAITQGANENEISTPIMLVSFLLMGIGIFFTVFAVRASLRDKAEKQKMADEQAAIQKVHNYNAQPINATAYQQQAKQMSDSRDALIKKATRNESIFLINNRNKEMQDGISFISIGNEVEFEFDDSYESCLVICGWHNIGYLPMKFAHQLKDGQFHAFVKDKFIDDNGKYNIEITILFFDNKFISNGSNGLCAKVSKGIQLPRNTKVVGVTYENRQYAVMNSIVNDSLIIKHYPSNDYPNAVAVFNRRLNLMLGYISSELAYDLLIAFGNNFKLFGSVTAITGGNNVDNVYGCNIVIIGN